MVNSRECPEGLNILKENNIKLIIFPSHTTHLLQPCDLGIFASLKSAMKKNKTKYLQL